MLCKQCGQEVEWGRRVCEHCGMPTRQLLCYVNEENLLAQNEEEEIRRMKEIEALKEQIKVLFDRVHKLNSGLNVMTFAMICLSLTLLVLVGIFLIYTLRVGIG